MSAFRLRQKVKAAHRQNLSNEQFVSFQSLQVQNSPKNNFLRQNLTTIKFALPTKKHTQKYTNPQQIKIDRKLNETHATNLQSKTNNKKPSSQFQIRLFHHIKSKIEANRSMLTTTIRPSSRAKIEIKQEHLHNQRNLSYQDRLMSQREHNRKLINQIKMRQTSYSAPFNYNKTISFHKSKNGCKYRVTSLLNKSKKQSFYVKYKNSQNFSNQKNIFTSSISGWVVQPQLQ